MTKLKFSDVVTAMASIVVASIVLDSLFSVAFARAFPEGADVAGVLSILVASLIVGYVFSLKMQENYRMRAIASIAILSSVVFMFYGMALFANPLVAPAVKEHISDAFATTSWTNDDWLTGIVMIMGLLVALALASIFVGVYAGSMLKRPKKT